MKKTFLIIALVAASFTSFAQTTETKPAKDTLTIVEVRVNWIDNIGTPAELSAECKHRQAIVREYAKQGYQFNKLVKSKKGLFIQFIK